jgi:uncharacterized membrane protein YidH (DUF202 family)
MRILGVLLLCLGLVALMVPSITFFTQERVMDGGFFQISMERPHTIILNPMVGVVAMIAGVVMLLAAPRRANW